MAEPLRTVLVGAVRHATGYAELLAAHPGYVLAGVAESDDADAHARSDARAVAAAQGVPLWRPEDVSPDRADVAVICSEPTRHAVLAERMLGLGLHVLVDKPLATDVAAACRVVEAARAAGRHCAVVTRALAPPIRRLRDWVDSGRLGLPRSVDAEFLSSGTHFAASVERPELLTDPRLSGGGEVMNVLGYPVDDIRAATGCEPVEVFAEAGTLFWDEHRSHGVEDVAVVSALFTHGLTASIVVGRVPAAPGPGPGTYTLRLIGSHGHVEVDVAEPAVRLYSGDGAERLPIDRSPVAAVLDDLHAAIRTGRRPAYDCADAAVAVATIDAVYRSLASGAPEPVDAGSATEPEADVSPRSSEERAP
ncbi:Gfo/Idh/MocA family protein [Jiangella anatolica]|uniref:Gfo/Idh/MocA family oxidoreductase n=1 Tax=Jiangella anatolica TaxID=2670374 RepID=A0A2W2CND8_9ACTN|nr:Gfo/Idh/MocA family oxidoreductase [Jiangella anatolica]PZF86696.1 gfo/Idh/MocA family oxidoreductase [Jiangella anatolica]